MWLDLQKEPLLSKYLWTDLWKNHCLNVSKNSYVYVYNGYAYIATVCIQSFFWYTLTVDFFTNQVTNILNKWSLFANQVTVN